MSCPSYKPIASVATTKAMLLAATTSVLTLPFLPTPMR